MPTERRTAQGTTWIADIETLRGVSILLVLFAHVPAAIYSETYLNLTRNWVQTWSGVDLFYAISGFVITRSLLTLLPGGEGLEVLPVLIGFWIRRVWRLLPAAWLWIAIAVVCAVASGGQSAFGSLRGNLADAAASLFWIQNVHYAACMRHLSPCEGVLAPYWSLSLEEQFYLIFPVLLAFLPRRWVVPLMVMVIIIQFPLQRGGDAQAALARWLRCDALAWGVLVARFAETSLYPAVAPVFLRRRVVRAAFWGLAVLSISIDPVLRGLGFYVGLIAMVCGGLVFVASYDQDLLGGGRVMRWFGSRSYAIYVCHIICARIVWQVVLLTAAPTADLPHRLGYLGCAVLLIGAAAELTHRMVERPLRLRGRRIARRIEVRLAARLATRTGGNPATAAARPAPSGLPPR